MLNASLSHPSCSSAKMDCPPSPSRWNAYHGSVLSHRTKLSTFGKSDWCCPFSRSVKIVSCAAWSTCRNCPFANSSFIFVTALESVESITRSFRRSVRFIRMTARSPGWCVSMIVCTRSICSVSASRKPFGRSSVPVIRSPPSPVSSNRSCAASTASIRCIDRMYARSVFVAAPDESFVLDEKSSDCSSSPIGFFSASGMCFLSVFSSRYVVSRFASFSICRRSTRMSSRSSRPLRYCCSRSSPRLRSSLSCRSNSAV